MTDTVINAAAAEEYSQALRQIGEGWWRQIAWASQQGIPQALGMSTREWAEEYHGYIRMPVPERREAVRELAAEGLTQPQIADVLGVNQGTVSRDLNPPMQMHTPEPEGMEDEPEFQGDSHPPMQMHTPEPPAAPESIEEPEPNAPKVQVNEGDEWYTPRWLFDALGIKYEIDVCSPFDRTYSSVPAERHFTEEDDGLAQPWDGTVWCNPPYSKPEPWARRIIHHGDGLLLTHIPMNAGWCVDVWETCDAIRLFQAMEFVRPDGTSQRPGYWLQLAAFGPIATEALSRLQPLGAAAFNKRRVASPMWRRAS